MTKSKITLFTSPSQKLVIYLDPTKTNKASCDCEFSKSQKRLVKKPLSIETYSTSNEPETYRDYGTLERKGVRKPVKKPSSIETYSTSNEPENYKDHPTPETKSLRKIYSPTKAVDDIISVKSVEEFIPRSFNTPRPKIENLEETIVKKYNVRDVPLPTVTEDSESVVEEVISSIIDNDKRTYGWQNTNANVINKNPVLNKNIRFDDKMTNRANKMNSRVLDSHDSSRPGLSHQSGERQDGNKMKVDEDFIQNVSTIIETDSFSIRKKQLDELLRNLSALRISENSSYASKLKNKLGGRWFGSKKKDDSKSTKSQKSLKRQASVPYFNHSFYHYRPKSRLEGLTFIPHKRYFVSVTFLKILIQTSVYRCF